MITLTYFVNSVGRPKHIRVMAGALEGDIFIGPKAEVRGMIFKIHAKYMQTVF